MSSGKSVLDRVSELESQVASQRQSGQRTNASIRQILAVFKGLIDELGGEELDKRVAARVQENAKKVKEAQDEQSKNIIKQLTEAGQLQVLDAIVEGTMLTLADYAVTQSFTKNEAGEDVAGETVRGECRDSFVQMPFEQFSPEVGKELLGKGVGFVYRLGDTEIEITGIYKMNPVPPVAPPEAPSENA